MMDNNFVCVKVMNSHDYGHFEVTLSKEGNYTFEQVDFMRKEAQRLVDKAIEQYKIAKSRFSAQLEGERTYKRLCKRRDKEIGDLPPSEWTPIHKALVKAIEDYEHWLSYNYDYQDDWEDVHAPDDEIPF